MDALPVSPQVQQVVTDALGAGVWAIGVALIYFIFRSVIDNMVAGLMIFIGREIRPDDNVILNGEAARIVRIGLVKTTFYVHIIDADENFLGGKVIHIPHSKLQDQSIAKPLPKFDKTFLDILKSESLKKRE